MVYDVRNWGTELMSKIEAHDSPIGALSVLDGKILSGGDDATVCLWDTSDPLQFSRVFVFQS